MNILTRDTAPGRKAAKHVAGKAAASAPSFKTGGEQVRMTSDSRKAATNITLPPALLQTARQLEVNISRAAEAGVRQAVAAKQAERWLAENQEAIASSNAYVAAHGLPLEKHRVF